MKLRLAALLFIAVPLGACSSSNLIVEQAARTPVRAQAVNLVYDNSTVNVSDDAVTYLRDRMENAFHSGDSPAFARGNDLTVRYRFVSFERGSRFVRYMLPGIAGGSTMLIEAEFVSPSGEVVARVRGQGQVAGGLLGGSHNSAIDSAVNQIREFAVANFGR